MLQLTIPISRRRGPHCINVNLEWHPARTAAGRLAFRCYCAWNKGEKQVHAHTDVWNSGTKNHMSRRGRFGRGYLGEGWFMGYDGAGACDLGKKLKTARQVAHWVEEKTTTEDHFTIYNFYLNKQKNLVCRHWARKETSSKSCWAWLKVGHSTAGVIDVTGATSTIRGELVDVRQCHCAQWNIHRSASHPPFWLPGWLALIFLRLPCTHHSLSKGPIG